MMTSSKHAPAASRHWRGRARVAQAMALVTVSGAVQRLAPMTWWSRVIGQPSEVPVPWGSSVGRPIPVRSGDRDEERVRRAISRAAQRLPWTPSCLAEAAAGQIMLRRRGKPGVVVVGLRSTDGAWDAHAWLLGERGALTGGPAADGFTATTVFEVPGGVRAVDIDLSVQTAHLS